MGVCTLGYRNDFRRKCVCMKMNLPNKLTIIRICMVPVFMIFLVAPIPMGTNLRLIISAAIFVIASLTDMLDGKIARARGLITDFGKFMDPLADKFLVFGALLGILVNDTFASVRPVFIWAATIVMFRELAVTSLRLVIAGKDGLVIAASWLGKVKTTTQIVCICCMLLEPVLFGGIDFFVRYKPLTWVTMAAMIIMTLWSGIDYIKTYWQFIDPEK